MQSSVVYSCTSVGSLPLATNTMHSPIPIPCVYIQSRCIHCVSMFLLQSRNTVYNCVCVCGVVLTAPLYTGELESVHHSLPQLVPQPSGHHRALPPLTELPTLLRPRTEVCQHRTHRQHSQGDRQAGAAHRIPAICLPEAAAVGPWSARGAGEDTVRVADAAPTEYGVQHSQGEVGVRAACSICGAATVWKVQ